MRQPGESVTDLYTTAIGALCQVAEVYYAAGRLDDALEVLAHGEQIAAAPGVRPRDRAALLIQVGAIMTYRGSFVTNEYESALAILQRAEQAAQQTDDRLLLASALDALGRGYYHRTMNTGEGGFEAAAAAFQQALALREAEADWEGVCESTFHIGLVAERRQQYDDALAAFDTARTLAVRHGYRHGLKDSLRHIGFAHMRAGDWAGALACFKESLAIIEELGLKVFLPFAHLSVGEMLQAQADWAAALRHYDIGYAQAEELQLRRAAMQIAYSIGEWHEAQGDEAQAHRSYQAAYEWGVALRHARGVALCAAKLGRVQQ